MRDWSREENFKQLMFELDVNNTIFPFERKGSDDGEVDFDKINYLVMRVDPLTRPALRDVYELSVLKTHIDREKGNLEHDDSHDTSSVLGDFLQGEINHGGIVSELTENLEKSL
jgi:hypothetical protein